jgi:hypothetical protein
MKDYRQIYLNALGFDKEDYIPCEISISRGIDLHHIIGRGKLGENRIENLMSLTRENHIKYGDNKKYMVYLLVTHRHYLYTKGVQFDNNWFEEKINFYE